MLLRGIYTFEPRPEDHNHTLPFTSNDTLIFLEILKRDSNWIKVADIYGRVGYVPKIFVEPQDDHLNPDLILTFLADAVVKARQSGLPSALPLELLRDEIRENPSAVEQRSKKLHRIFGEPEEYGLKAQRSRSDHHMNKKSRHRNRAHEYAMAYQQPRQVSSVELNTEKEDRRHEVVKRHHNYKKRPGPKDAEHVKLRRDENQNQSDLSVRTAREGSVIRDRGRSKPNKKSNQPIPPAFQRIKTDLVCAIQEKGGLDQKISENILNEVFQRIKDSSHDLQVESFMDRLSLSNSHQNNEYDNEEPMTELVRVMRYISNLSRECIKQDGGKRKGHCPSQADLDKLKKLLMECDPLHAAKKLELGHHAFSQDLVHLYHLESPMLVKERMLDIFLIICSLDKKGRCMLVSSKLPIYLARELMSMKPENKIFEQAIDLLTMLLSCGESMPDTHFQILGSGFANYLLREVELVFSKSSENEYDKMSAPFSAVIKLILAYNLQFGQDVKENILLKVVAERWKRPRGFITVMIELFRKASDPLHLERQSDLPRSMPHSVFKMVADLCLCQKTVANFTPEDRTQLKNSIIDGLCDHPAGSIRLGYLNVLRALLGYIQQNLKDIRTALLSILLETDPLAIPEQHLIRQMSKEFPSLFLNSISRIKTNVGGESSMREEDNFSYLSS